MSRPMNPPIYWSSTFAFEHSNGLIEAARRARERFTGEGDPDVLYTRWDNPTIRVVERALARLEKAEDALAFASGMAAIATTLLAFLRQGDGVLALETLYGGTMELLKETLPGWGIRTAFFPVDMTDLDRLMAEFQPRLVYVESPTNPTLDVVPLDQIADRAHQYGALAVIDNTFATPVVQNPLDFGFDLVVHSATKALCGHHDVMGGFVAGSREHLNTLWNMRKLLGGVMDPMAAYMIYRGMRTLHVRMQQQSRSAMKLARFLAEHPRVEAVLYPGLESHPGHTTAVAQMRSFGSMLSFRYRGDARETTAMVDRLQVFHKAASLGGVDSLVTQPATTSHVAVDLETRRRLGVTDNLVRLSVGLEPVEILRDDLARALEA